MIHKHRNPVILKCLFQIVSIYIHITDDHTDISVSVLLFTYQSADSLCHCICFLSWVPCCMDFQILHSFIIPSRPVPEDISLQKCKFLVLRLENILKQEDLGKWRNNNGFESKYICFFKNFN